MGWVEIVRHDSEGELYTAESFLSRMRASNNDWWDEHGTSPWIFRGHRVSSWRLVPAARRSRTENLNEELMQLRVQLMRKFFQPDPLNRAADVVLLYEFAKTADQLGIQVPLTFGRHATFDEVLSLGQEALRPLAAVAQHHGLPTTLLDWTDDPLVACHFACVGALKGSDSVREDIGVWAWNSKVGRDLLDRHRGSKGLTTYALYSPPVAGNTFQRAQRGLFLDLVAGSDLVHWNGEYPSLGDILEVIPYDDWSAPIAEQHVLSGAEAAPLERLLMRERVSDVYLKPSLDSIAAHAMSSWRLRERLVPWGQQVE